MVSRQTLVVVSVVLMATLAVVVPAVSAASVTDDQADPATITQAALQTATDSQTTATDAAAENESAFGTQMTAFMQSNAAQTEDTVDHGMWESAFDRANESERVQISERRADRLDDRLTELRERNRTLAEHYRNGSITYDEYVARTSELSGRIEALKDGVNGTANAMEHAGLNVSALDTVRTNARNLTGPEVAGVARSITSGDRGPPEGVPGRGPPGEDATDRTDDPPVESPGNQPGDGNATADSGNATTGPPNDVGGPDASGDSGNATQGPGAPGNGNDGPPPGRSDGDDDGDPDSSTGNDGEGDGAPGNGNSGDDRPGNSGGGSDRSANGGQDDGSGNSGDNPGQGPASRLVGDTLFTD